MTDQIEVELTNKLGQKSGTFTIRLLPRTQDFVPDPLIDRRDDLGGDREFLAPIQLLEQFEYRYQFDDVGCEVQTSNIEFNKSELFEPDDESWKTGRIKTRNYTGLVKTEICADDQLIGEIEFEVRSRKLKYLEDYRVMLSDIAGDMSEVIMHRFSPAEQRFSIDNTKDARTLYQRFAFLKSLLESELFSGAIQYILHNPHQSWKEEEEFRRPNQGIRCSSNIVRQIVTPGPRVQANLNCGKIQLNSLPKTFRVVRHHETVNNQPNRFVKFALNRWRDVIAQIHDILSSDSNYDSEPVKRGIKETKELMDRIDPILSEDLFREVGELHQFPGSNQVLQRKEGYHQVFKAYIQFEVAAQLTWDAAEDIYHAGQRDVATLYEYWVYLQIGKIISEYCDEEFHFESMLEPTNGGLNLTLKRNEETILEGVICHNNRKLQIKYVFNKHFSAETETWTISLRPDCSVCIRPLDPKHPFFFQKVWLHFDAKYKLRSEIADEDEQEDGTPEKSRVYRSDYQTMHAYRDAIQLSSGAYIIYPGQQMETRLKYTEILPGLGAFPLRPSRENRPRGSETLSSFIGDVIEHISSQVTQHERAEFWINESYSDDVERAGFPAVSFLSKPPDDTKVLLGWVRGKKHLEWIRSQLLYNLRAEHKRAGSVGLSSEKLSAELLVLYSSRLSKVHVWKLKSEEGKDEPLLFTRDEMIDSGYPQPRGSVYLCLPLQEEITAEMPFSIEYEDVRTIYDEIRKRGAPQGSPQVLNWKDFLGSLHGKL